MMTFILWLLLLFLCWPLAVLALVAYPIVWLLTLPFRLLGMAVNGVFELLRGIVLLPARILRGPRGFAPERLPRPVGVETGAEERHSCPVPSIGPRVPAASFPHRRIR